MSEVAARASIMAVLAQIQEDFTAYPLVIEADNRETVNQETQAKPYLKIFIDFLAARQADMSDHPLICNLGQIVIQVVVKAGSGTADAAALRDFIVPYFELKVLGSVNCRAAEPYRSQLINGWEHMPILINFWQHRISA